MTNPTEHPAAQGVWLLGPASLRIPLGCGSYLICTQGTAWLTEQSAAPGAAGRDTVLACGERFVARRAAVVFVSAFRGRPARVAVGHAA